MKNNSAAIPQLNSFASQVAYFGYKILQNLNADCTISLERIGDVGIEGDNNEMIELKNSQSNSNPLSNKSLDLWKSIYNWALLFYENNDYDVKKFTLYLYVNTQRKLQMDISKQIDECESEEDAKKIYRYVVEKLLGKKRMRAQRSLNDIKTNDIKKFEDYIALLSSKELYPFFLRVLEQVKIVIDETHYYNQIHDWFKVHYTIKSAPGFYDNLSNSYLGWVNDKVLNYTNNGKPPIIHTSEYQDFTSRYLAGNIGINRFVSSNIRPTDMDIEEEIKQVPQYIEQLHLVNSGDCCNNAAYTYLKLLIDRSKWVKQGVIEAIDDERYNQYQKDLRRVWQESIGQIALREKNLTEAEKGRLLHLGFREKNSILLDGELLQDDLFLGFANEMANLDTNEDLSIGWHPKYKDLLIKNGDEDE